MSGERGNEQTALVGGTVIDGNGGMPIQDGVVLIEDDKITQVGKRNEVRVPKGTRIIDVSGQFVLPGLIDIHVHYQSWMGELFLFHGVTTVKDMGNDIEWISSVHKGIECGQVSGPRLFYVGNGLDAPPPSKDHHVGLDGPDMARRAVEILHQRGASAVKVREKITPELLCAITDIAHRLGIPVTGHIGRMNAADAAVAGIDGLEHATGVLDATSDYERLDEPGLNEIERFIAEFKAYSRIDPKRVEALIELLVSNDVALIPTMSTWWRMATHRRDDFAREDARYAEIPELSDIPKFIRQILETSSLFIVGNADDLAQLQAGFGQFQQVLRQHYEAGGKVLAASDTVWSIPGLSMLRELLMLVDAGFTPSQAIKMATQENAEFLGQGDALGTIMPGKLADLISVEADPLADISNIQRIGLVMKGGRIIDRALRTDGSTSIPEPNLTRPLWLERQLVN